jgi:PEP-CTERM motif
MVKNKISNSGALLVALALTTAGTSWATLSSCGAAPGTTLAALLGDGTNNPVNGCGQSDLGFNTFAAVDGAGSIASPTTSQIEISTSGGVNGGTTITPVVALYTLTGGNSITTGGGTIIGTFNATGAPVSGQSAPSNPPFRWLVDGLGLTFTATSSAHPTNAESVEVQEAFCLGQATFSCATTSSEYGYLSITEDIAANTGTVTYNDVICTPGVGGCTQTTATTASLSLALAAYSVAATQLSIDINRPNDSGNVLTLGSISTTWNQIEGVPEPSTFVLFGSALAGLVTLRVRRGKRAQ